MSQPDHFDHLIIGTGNAALTVAALLARAGRRVCMLEAHEVPGGYAHSFGMDGYTFCAHVHYVWGCAPGQTIHRFLSKLGLEQELTFEALDPDGYDRVALPDGKQVGIPYGLDRLIDAIDAAYPGERPKLERFVTTLTQIHEELLLLPEPMTWWKILPRAPWLLTLIKYRHATLLDLFEECGLSREARAVLSGNSGDFMAPPEELSLFAYVCLMGGYNEGAYYPTQHFQHYIGRLARFVAEQPGCEIHYQAEVTGIDLEGDRVSGVHTASGQHFIAEDVICNMDPRRAAELIGLEQFPEGFREALTYDYSPSSFIIYLGLEGIDLRDHGFGNYNIWHLEQWDLDQAWREAREDNYDQPWLFLSTPSLHSPAPGVTPPGGQILEFGSVANYDTWRALKDRSPQEYAHRKHALTEQMMQIVERRYVKDLRRHVRLRIAGSPTTNERFCWSPFGNAYGSHISPANMGLGRLSSETPWENFHWCNASGGYPGIHGTTLTGVALYERLTGDRVLDPEQAPSTEEAIAYAVSRAR